MSFRAAFLQCVSQNYGKIHSVVVIFIRDNIRKRETINANNFIKRSCSAKITKKTLYYFYLSVLAGRLRLLRFYVPVRPGRVAQSVGQLTRKSGVLGSIPDLATYFRFSFRFFKKGSCQLLAKVCA